MGARPLKTRGGTPTLQVLHRISGMAMPGSFVEDNPGSCKFLRMLSNRSHFLILTLFLAEMFLITPWAVGQDRLKAMPGYKRYEKINREAPNTIKSGSISVTWTNEGDAFEYQRDGKRYRFDILSGKSTE